jgi:hypothetical protein
LIVGGVPGSLIALSYVAEDSLTFLESPSRGRIICFGRTGLVGMICVDPKTGEVLQVASNDLNSERTVNASLCQFSHSVRAVIGRFPFYGEDDDPDTYETVGSELADMIREIDPNSFIEASFWGAFVDDVGIGDYVTEEIITDDLD